VIFGFKDEAQVTGVGRLGFLVSRLRARDYAGPIVQV
jgi:hypothetical protein